MKATPQGVKANALMKDLEKLFRERLRTAYEPLYKHKDKKSLAATRPHNSTKNEE